MGKITIQMKWWEDPRREVLGQLLGKPRETEHIAARAWMLAQEHWEKGELIPGEVFICLPGAMELLTARLAYLHEGIDPDSPRKRVPIPYIAYNPGAENKGPLERDPNELRTHINEIESSFIYIKGAAEHLSWGVSYRQQRVEAGRRSAKKRALLYGTAQPKKIKKEDSSNGPRTNSNGLEHTSTSTDPGSSTGTNPGTRKNTHAGIRTDYPQEFDQVWSQYERKGDKKAAFQVWDKLKLTEAEATQLTQAITFYKRGKPEVRYRKDLERFLAMDWRELARDDLSVNGHGEGVHPSTQARILAFEKYKAMVEARENGGSDEQAN